MCVYIYVCIYIYINIYIYIYNFAVHLKLTQHCKSTTLQFKKRGVIDSHIHVPGSFIISVFQLSLP